MRFCETIEVRVGPEQALEYAADFRNLIRWDPSVLAVTPFGEDVLSPGTGYRVALVFAGLGVPMDYRLTAFEPGRRARLEGRGAAAIAIDEIRTEAVEGGARLVWDAEIRIDGIVGWFDPVLRYLYAGNVRAAVENLREEINRLVPVVPRGGRSRVSAAAAAAAAAAEAAR